MCKKCLVFHSVICCRNQLVPATCFGNLKAAIAKSVNTKNWMELIAASFLSACIVKDNEDKLILPDF